MINWMENKIHQLIQALPLFSTRPVWLNGDLESYIEPKAPEPDISGLVEKPGDCNGDLEYYIELKAPAQITQDLSCLVTTTDLVDHLGLEVTLSLIPDFYQKVSERKFGPRLLCYIVAKYILTPTQF